MSNGSSSSKQQTSDVGQASGISRKHPPSTDPTDDSRPGPSHGPPTKQRVVSYTSRYEEVKTRPSHVTDTKGSSGAVIPLSANYVVLKSLPKSAIYQYHVEFEPPVESKPLRKKLIRDHEGTLGRVRAFDGMMLYLPKLLGKETLLMSKLQEGGDVKISIRFTTELQPGSTQCLQHFNILLRRVLEKLNMKQIGRHYYSPHLCINVPQHKVDILPGFITSILLYESSIMLSVEVSHKLLRTMTVLEMLYSMHASVKTQFHTEASRKLIGMVVITRYNNKTYRIDDIDWNRNPTATFETKKGVISFLQYYESAYNKKIRDKEQPLLVSMPKKKDQRMGFTGPILLVPELCYVTGISDEMRSDFRVMKDLATHTRLAPAQRKKTLQNLIDEINRNPESQEILSGWNLQFDRSLVALNGRVLPTEKIHQKGHSFTYDQNGDWTKDMRGCAFISPVTISDFLIVFTRFDGQKVHEFVKTLIKVGGPMGMDIRRPNMCEIPNDQTDSYIRALSQNIHPNLKLAICVLPRNTKDRYDAIKKFCCVDKPVPSQCIVSRTLGKNLMSVTTKIALQLNCKLGGELWAVEIPIKNTMVIGIDSYHDTSQKGRSVFGFIASTNSSLTKYFCQCVFQSPGQELGTNLVVCMTAALRRYNELNKTLPDRIFVYRDGVGEGQLQHVFEFEAPQFKECFKGISAKYNPKFTFIVVTKRVNTRLVVPRGNDQASNPPPGTVVDSVITKRHWYDFFLVSQSVRQGTVAPSHYNVIADTSGLKPDHIQRLSYKLCHLYYNWPGTIRVPAPCQYAHKLAYLVGESVHKEPSLSLANRLYFL